MITVVSSQNSIIFRELGSPAFRRVGVRHEVARDGNEALSLVRERRPAVAILDVEMPAMSGYEVCQQIKQDPGLRDTRVVLLLEGSIDAAVIHKLNNSRCDDVLVTPAHGEELFHKIAQMLGLPRRARRRMAVQLDATLESGETTCHGQVVDLNPQGARLELDGSVRKAREVSVRITPDDAENPVIARARVVWERPSEAGQGVVCGVHFQEISHQTRTTLEDLALWEVAEKEDRTLHVAFQGDFREHTDFSRLVPRLAGRVIFDLEGVRYLNSAGVRHWVEFVRRLAGVRSYVFVRCSVAFVTQASMVPEVLGQGQVESFYVPYACERCELEEERLHQTATLTGAGRWPPEVVSYACPRCQGALTLDDVPERYFAFLEQSQRLEKRIPGDS